MEERRLGETPTLPASQSTGSEEFEREYTKQFCSHIVRNEVLVVENNRENRLDWRPGDIGTPVCLNNDVSILPFSWTA